MTGTTASRAVSRKLSLWVVLWGMAGVAAVLAFIRSCLVHPAIIGITLYPIVGFGLPLLAGSILLTAARFVYYCVSTAIAAFGGRRDPVDTGAPAFVALAWTTTAMILASCIYLTSVDWRLPLTALLAAPAAWMVRAIRNRRSRRVTGRAIVLLSIPAAACFYVSALGPLWFVGTFAYVVLGETSVTRGFDRTCEALHEPLYWVLRGEMVAVWWSRNQRQWFSWGIQYGEALVDVLFQMFQAGGGS